MRGEMTTEYDEINGLGILCGPDPSPAEIKRRKRSKQSASNKRRLPLGARLKYRKRVTK
jgi:hypothetical protein